VLYQWRTTFGDEDGEWFALFQRFDEQNGAIPVPAVQQYPLMPSVKQRRIPVSINLVGRMPNGSTATAGSAAILINGSAVALGETIAEINSYVALNVTSVGEAEILAFCVVWELV
jgi:hypothetical protein